MLKSIFLFLINFFLVPQAVSSNLTIQLPGISYHLTKYEDFSGENKKYNAFNLGAGLQLNEQLNENWTLKYSIGLIKDSFNSFGGYVGVTSQYEMYASKAIKIEAGFGGFLFYRTMDFYSPRKIVPAILPVVSITSESGYGANLVLIPSMKHNQSKIPGVVFLQLTKKFN